MIDTEYDEGAEPHRKVPAFTPPKDVDRAPIDGLLSFPPLLPGGKRFRAGQKHWLVEFKTCGFAKGDDTGVIKEDRLTEIALLEINPFSRSLEKVGAETFHVFVKPECAVSSHAMTVNGHSATLLNGKGNFKSIAQALADRLKHNIVYTRNMKQFESVVGRQLIGAGFGTFQSLRADVVDVKKHGLDLKIIKTLAIDDLWRAFGIKFNPNEKVSMKKLDTFRQGLACLRGALPPGADVLPLSASMPNPDDDIVIKVDKRVPVQETLELDYSLSPTAKQSADRKADLLHAREKAVPTGGDLIARKQAGERPKRKNSADVATREHVVCVREPTAREKVTGKHNYASDGAPVLHISARTGRNVYRLVDGSVLYSRTFAAGKGSQRRANTYREAVAEIYGLLGYRRYTETPTVRERAGKRFVGQRSRKPSEVRDIDAQMRLALHTVFALPLTAEQKNRVLDQMAGQAIDPTFMGKEIDATAPVHRVFAKVREVINAGRIDEDWIDELNAEGIKIGMAAIDEFTGDQEQEAERTEDNTQPQEPTDFTEPSLGVRLDEADGIAEAQAPEGPALADSDDQPQTAPETELPPVLDAIGEVSVEATSAIVPALEPAVAAIVEAPPVLTFPSPVNVAPLSMAASVVNKEEETILNTLWTELSKKNKSLSPALEAAADADLLRKQIAILQKHLILKDKAAILLKDL